MSVARFLALDLQSDGAPFALSSQDISSLQKELDRQLNNKYEFILVIGPLGLEHQRWSAQK